MRTITRTSRPKADNECYKKRLFAPEYKILLEKGALCPDNRLKEVSNENKESCASDFCAPAS